MPKPDYYRKQIELLLEWAVATPDNGLRMTLIEWGLDLLVLASADDQTLRLVQEALQTMMPANTEKV